jgi:hypothetical protein
MRDARVADKAGNAPVDVTRFAALPCPARLQPGDQGQPDQAPASHDLRVRDLLKSTIPCPRTDGARIRRPNVADVRHCRPRDAGSAGV